MRPIALPPGRVWLRVAKPDWALRVARSPFVVAALREKASDLLGDIVLPIGGADVADGSPFTFHVLSCVK